MTTQDVRYVCNFCHAENSAASRRGERRRSEKSWCDCRLVSRDGTGRYGGDGSDGCEAGDGEERADC
eukprot:6917835-Prymnesium_polylepis.1